MSTTRFKTTYNGTCLDDSVSGFTTLGAEGRSSGVLDVTYKDYPTDGADIFTKRIDKRTLTVSFVIYGGTRAKVNKSMAELQGVLNCSECKVLNFSDETDRYYNAMFDGIEIEKLYTEGLTGTINFTIPDGLAHSNVLKTFKLVPLYQENTTTIIGYKFDVKNEGNVAVPVNFHIPMASGEENGYLGLAASTGAMEFGNIEEADTTTAYKNVCLLNLQGGAAIKNAMTVGTGVMTENFAHSGEMTTGEYYNPKSAKSAGIFLKNGANWGSTNNTMWYGACGRIPIPADTVYSSQPLYNWQLNINLAFASHSRIQQTGMMQIVVAYDDNGTEKIMCDMHIMKDNWGNNNARMKFKIQGANGQSSDLSKMDVKEYKYEPRSDVGITCAGNGKVIYIKKYKSKFTICFNGEQFSYDVPDNATRIPTSITIAFLDRKDFKEHLVFMGVQSIQFFKTNVGYQVDVPNRYAAGDVLEIHGDEGKFYVNGNQQQADECLGTKYIKALPNATTEVQMSVSSWCPISKIYDEGNAYAWIEEAWL